MVDRKVQKITSPYGPRGEKFHAGVDLRCYNFANWKKQRIIFPERCKVVRIGYQTEWGWNVIAETMNEKGLKDYTLKFIHLEKPLLETGKIYGAGEFVGWTTITDYMKQLKYYEHLHFETLYDGKHFDPTIYFDERGIEYA